MVGSVQQPGARPQGAHVRVPPPALYAVPLAVSALLDRRLPFPLPGGRTTRRAGLALVIAGLGLGASGAGTFRREHTTVVPHHEVSTFVTSGPYRFTRNPMYLGMTTAYTGAALALRSAWPLTLLPGILTAMDRLVIRREEAYLRTRFGAPYDAYRDRVRRWV